MLAILAPGACAAFHQGGGGSRSKILKNIGVPGAFPAAQGGWVKSLTLLPPPPVHAPEHKLKACYVYLLIVTCIEV